MNQTSQYILNLYHYLLNLRDTLEYTIDREHSEAFYQNRKNVLNKGLDKQAALGNFLEQNKENGAKIKERIEEFINEFYSDDSTVLRLTADGKVRVDHTQHVKIYDYVVGVSESIRDILYGYINHARNNGGIEKEVEELVALDERLYRRVLAMLVMRDFEKSFAEFQKVVSEAKGKATPQSNYIVQNEIVKMAGFLRFSRQHARCTDNATLDLLDEVNAVIEMTEGRRDRRDGKSFQVIFNELNGRLSQAVAEVEPLWKERFSKTMEELVKYQDSLKEPAAKA